MDELGECVSGSDMELGLIQGVYHLARKCMCISDRGLRKMQYIGLFERY